MNKTYFNIFFIFLVPALTRLCYYITVLFSFFYEKIFIFFCIYCTFLVPATIIESEKNYTVKMNNDITMDCQAEGDQPIPVSWSFGGRALNVHNNPRHKVTKAINLYTTYYT